MGAGGDRIKRREEEDSQRVKAKESIANELRNVLADAEVYLAAVTQPHSGFITVRPFTDAKDATIGSGTFALIEPELQEHISYVYVYISQGLEQMRRIRDFDTGFGLTIQAHIQISLMAAMQDQLAAAMSELPGRLPELIRRLTEAPTSTSEEVNEECGPSP